MGKVIKVQKFAQPGDRDYRPPFYSFCLSHSTVKFEVLSSFYLRIFNF